MKKLTYFLLYSLLLTSMYGCLHQTVNIEDVKVAQQTCSKNNSTLDNFEVWLINDTLLIKCTDGKKYKSKDSI